MTFNQRRKTIRNTVKPLIGKEQVDNVLFTLRPETLSVEQFIELTNIVSDIQSRITPNK